uniref:COP9 signalosome complex subunit 4 n=1 Tax=Hemiselmis tepida TaxID=464990 RepID=A0A7S0VKD4_9CRYP
MTDAHDALDAIERIGTHAQKVEEYKKLATKLLTEANMQGLSTFVRRLSEDPPQRGEAVPTMISRQVLQDFVSELFNSSLPQAQRRELGQLALQKLKARLSSFEEPFSIVSEKMADILQADEDWAGAASVLSQIPLTSSQRNISDDYKAKMYVRIAMLYLEAEDEVAADTFVGRSHALVGKSDFTNLEVKFQHQACRARIYDAKRKFQDAARHYYDLSQVGKATVIACMGEEAAAQQGDLDRVIEQQNLEALSKAGVCAILAPAGPERSRLLAMLCKDERSSKLPMFPMLKKIYLERVIRAPEIEQFQKLLKPHQMAMTSDGLTVLQKAMIEHNLFAAAHMYNNITFEELGFFLHLSADRAEGIARGMLLENRIPGSIDQIEGMIYFSSADSTQRVKQWDAYIAGACMSVNDITQYIATNHPSYLMPAES